MTEHVSQTSFAGLLIASAALGAGFAWWMAAPFDGEFNTVFVAVVVALVVALITPVGMFVAFMSGAAFICISLTWIVPQDPSGLAPPTLTIPIQSIFASGPMAGAAWVGRELRGRLSRRHTEKR